MLRSIKLEPFKSTKNLQTKIESIQLATGDILQIRQGPLKNLTDGVKKLQDHPIVFPVKVQSNPFCAGVLYQNNDVTLN